MMTKTVNHHPKQQTLPANIMLDKWADIGFKWQGSLSSTELKRLSEQTTSDSVLDLTFALTKQEGIVWLNYQVSGEVFVTCQRCLESLGIDVSGEYRLAVLSSDGDIGRINDAEYILVDELTTKTAKLPIKDLLEDELLLTLPLSPKHQDCDMPVQMLDEEEYEEEQENPFASLAQLKGKLS